MQNIGDVEEKDLLRVLASHYIDIGVSVGCSQPVKPAILRYFQPPGHEPFNIRCGFGTQYKVGDSVNGSPDPGAFPTEKSPSLRIASPKDEFSNGIQTILDLIENAARTRTVQTPKLYTVQIAEVLQTGFNYFSDMVKRAAGGGSSNAKELRTTTIKE